MRRRRRFLALLFIVTAFVTPLGFFYLTIVNETRHDDLFPDTRFQTVEVENERIPTSKDFSRFSDLECSKFPHDVATNWPECLAKMAWIRSGWKTHKCYADNQVDGSECSFRYYLSEIEEYCPAMEEESSRNLRRARMSPSIRKLLPILEGVPHYMKTRITRLWGKWKEGAHEVLRKYEEPMSTRRKLNVLVFIGFLANEQKLKFAKKSDHGGPLGELLQWSDLLASLSIIGHHLEVSTDKTHMRSIIYEYTSRGPCLFVNGSRQHLDIIFTDIMGLNILRQQHRQFLMNNRCRIRLLDSFGTHAEFANKSYFVQNKKSLSGNFSQRNPWGGHGLDLRQHWTFYPHSDDNTFLGFVVDTVDIRGDRKDQKDQGEHQKPNALVYGKEQYMWKDAEKPIGVLKKLTQVHATVADLSSSNSSKVFDDVINHGFLNPDQISELLDSIQIFFGLGFPLEGPAPLEAIAHGAVFINAKFKEPKSRRNYRFLAEKPTLRQWTSQNPYMEMLGEPHVVTVDIENEQELEAAIRRAIELKPPSKVVPFEFSPAGMLLRVAVLLENQNFCDKVAVSKIWPPVDQMKIFKSNNSCEEECHSRNLICEPSYFSILNSKAFLEKHFPCRSMFSKPSPVAPFNCTLQSTTSLFSCASIPTDNVIRLCPCRDFIPEQHAVCQKCL